MTTTAARTPAFLAAAAALVVLAAAFQIHATPTLLGTGIRISLADLAFPVVLACLLWGTSRAAVRRTALRVPRTLAWLAALTAVMTLALVLGRLEIGQWFGWALVNKYLGWFVLLAYFGLGVLAVRADARRRAVFLKAFVIVAAGHAVLALVLILLTRAGIDVGIGHGHQRARGLMENPNAFAFLAAIALAFLLPAVRSGRLLPRPWALSGASLLLAAVAVAGSRSVWFGLALALAALALLGGLRWRDALWAGAGGAAVTGAFIVLSTVATANGDTPSSGTGAYVLAHPIFSGDDFGTRTRIDAVGKALALWRDDPVFGSGLGTYLWREMADPEVYPAQIHSTPLWILTEMGLVGALAFGAFYLACLRALWPARPGPAADRDPFLVGAVAMLVLFAATSLGQEMMYQRHLWFLLGMALVRSAGVGAAGPDAHGAGPSGVTERGV